MTSKRPFRSMITIRDRRHRHVSVLGVATDRGTHEDSHVLLDNLCSGCEGALFRLGNQKENWVPSCPTHILGVWISPGQFLPGGRSVQSLRVSRGPGDGVLLGSAQSNLIRLNANFGFIRRIIGSSLVVKRSSNLRGFLLEG